jgi:hypothetical protein
MHRTKSKERLAGVHIANLAQNQTAAMSETAATSIMRTSTNLLMGSDNAGRRLLVSCPGWRRIVANGGLAGYRAPPCMATAAKMSSIQSEMKKLTNHSCGAMRWRMPGDRITSLSARKSSGRR